MVTINSKALTCTAFSECTINQCMSSNSLSVAYNNTKEWKTDIQVVSNIPYIHYVHVHVERETLVRFLIWRFG